MTTPVFILIGGRKSIDCTGVRNGNWSVNGTQVCNGTYPYGEVSIFKDSLGISLVTSSLNGTEVVCQVGPEFMTYLVIVEGGK